ncbi:CLUMA_CG006465, isoform A [Clunio marinus]|uniref:CLUMA_CG006465, isoform A n=1 Tax=Clunio marinus TaxID=568069 RepID=A0A1J1I0A9_9DIPT|nr:CLUMA_CG006465, isoform A [Clunio marinus]
MDKYAIPNKLPSKQITVLTHRKRRIEQKKAALQKTHKKKIVKPNDGEHFKKPEFFVAEYRKAERDDKRIKRQIMRNGIQNKNIKENTLIVAIRHRGTHIASEQCMTMLNMLNLHRMHQAVFLRFTPEVSTILSLVEPYVIYGTPDVGSVRDLIFKYGFVKYNGKKSAISSNIQIEEIFGNIGIICVEDIVHEIISVGPNFDKVTKMMYPFVLPNPKDGWLGKKGLAFKKGGVAGFRGDKLNELLKTII